MLLFLRKAMFYILLVVYLIITPYTILYALGYIIHPREVALIKTGLLVVETEPDGARIFVQGRRFSGRTPAAIRGLEAGRYRVRVAKKGHLMWEKDVNILPERTTELAPVLLLPEKPTAEAVSPASYRGLVPGPAGRRGLYGLIEFNMLVWDSRGRIHRIDMPFGRSRQVPLYAETAGKHPLGVMYEKGSELAVFEYPSGGKGRRFMIVDAGGGDVARNLRSLLHFNADWVDWDPRNASRVYFLENGGLLCVDVRRGAIYPRIATGLAGFGAGKNRLYLLRNDYTLFATGWNGENPEPVLDEYPFLRELLSAAGARYFRVEPVERDLILFLSDQGRLISSRPPHLHVPAGVRGVDVYRRLFGDPKILFWTEKTIGWVDFQTADEDGTSAIPSKKIFYTGGSGIRQAFWSYDDSHVVFLDRDAVFLAEVRGPEPRLIRKLADVVSGSLVDYYERGREIFYLEKSTGRLTRQKIVD